MSAPGLAHFPLMELFRTEAETQARALTQNLLALERVENPPVALEALMRAAHSLKGAARIVGLEAAVRISHAMEDFFVAAQEGKITIDRTQIDLLLNGVDLLLRVAGAEKEASPEWESSPEIQKFLSALGDFIAGRNTVAPAPPKESPETVVPAPTASDSPEGANDGYADRILRVTAARLDRLLGLSGEALVEARWLDPFSRSLLRLKRMQHDVEKELEALRDSLSGTPLAEEAETRLAKLRSKTAECRHFLGERLVELELYDQRSGNLSRRLYDGALACRMRPFSDCAQHFPRLVRDVARSLEKVVDLTVIGGQTQVDRDLLEKLEAPLSHLLRNALDHGIEAPEERVARGKPRAGALTVEARHSAGMLQITIRDDGRGIDPEAIRRAVVARSLTTAETAATLTDAELMEFLYLPGFTMKETVTEISGRGVGLDVVQDAMKRVRGFLRTTTELGRGATFQLQLPLTLSVMRALLVEIGGEPYALPLAAITRTVMLEPGQIRSLEGRQHFAFEGRNVGLVSARQILEKESPPLSDRALPVIVLGDRTGLYGVVVDRFLGEREIVVRPLDPRLGKIKNLAAAALADDGAPMLILDVEDVQRSIEKILATGRLSAFRHGPASAPVRRKRVLVVEDSLTVRELERKLIESRGYEVEVAVDGMDGWNAVRTGDHDLVVTDVDMPRLDGIELISLIRRDPHLRNKPVMIVSYKDREEDRIRGLDAGADYYLTKGSFHDEGLVKAVEELIGTP